MWGNGHIQHWRKTKCLVEFFEHVNMELLQTLRKSLLVYFKKHLR
jgi:hypothetical protein